MQSNSPNRRARARRAARGFSLLELVIVLAVLAILAGAAVPAVSAYVNAKRREATQLEMAQLADASLAYFRDTLQLPSALAALESDPGLAGWSGPYLSSSANDELAGLPSAQVDGWSTAYALVATGASSLALSSAGADRSFGSSDDLAIAIDATPVRRAITLERLATINQSVLRYNAQYLGSANLSSTWSAAKAQLVAAGLLPNDADYDADAWGTAFVADPIGQSPVVRFNSAHLM